MDKAEEYFKIHFPLSYNYWLKSKLRRNIVFQAMKEYAQQVSRKEYKYAQQEYKRGWKEGSQWVRDHQVPNIK